MNIDGRGASQRVIVTKIMAGVLVFALSSCGPSAPAPTAPTQAATANAPSTPWQACEYQPIAYGSVTATIPSTLSPLAKCNVMRTIVANGYVSANNAGEAKLTNDMCTLYVFQEGSVFIYSDVTVELCPSGKSCAISETDTCSKLVVVNLAGTSVTFQGTTTTIFYDRTLGIAIVLVSEGTATIASSNGSKLSVGPDRAVYVATAEAKARAFELFGFDSGQIVPHAGMVAPIGKLGATPQMQRANLMLITKKLKPIPLPVIYQVGFRWLVEKYDREDINTGISRIADWKQLMSDAGVVSATLRLETMGKPVNLSGTSVDLSAARVSLTQSGFAKEPKVTLLVDERIPGMSKLAQAFSAALRSVTSIQSINIVAATPESALEIMRRLELTSTPVLYLGGL